VTIPAGDTVLLSIPGPTLHVAISRGRPLPRGRAAGPSGGGHGGGHGGGACCAACPTSLSPYRPTSCGGGRRFVTSCSSSSPYAGSYTYDAFGRVTAMPNGLASTYYANDRAASQALGAVKEEWALDPARRFRSFTTSTFDGISWTTDGSRLNHYGNDSDSPHWIIEDTTTGALTRMVSGPDGFLAATTTATGSPTFQVLNLHGDVATTLGANLLPAGFNRFDEFGVPTAGQAKARYGWLGGKQRSSEAVGGTILMGVRVYDPDTGRFTSVDPVAGGSATAYDCVNQDPVNVYDLDGQAPVP
jgi:RHS repeat-associated protein